MDTNQHDGVVSLVGIQLQRQAGQWALTLVLVLLLSACGTPSPANTPEIRVSTSTAMSRLINQLATSEQFTSRITTTPSSTATVTATSTVTASPTPTTFTGVIPTVPSTTPIVFTPATRTVTQNRATVATPENFTSGILHTVNRGESLTIIGNQYGVTVQELLDANGMFLSQVIVPGQSLLIPVPTLTPVPSSTIDSRIRGAIAQQIISAAQPDLPPETVNDLQYREFFDLSPQVIDNVREIYARGQALGRNPDAFSRTGDSTIEPPHFFYRFDETDYHLGEYGYLQRTIDYYAGSFAYNNVSVQRGLHIWSIFDPMWSPRTCDAGEHMLACEIRQHNPSVMIIRLGTNDRVQTELIRDAYEEMVVYCMDQGVIPILGTKADRFDGANNPVNTIIRELAAEYQLPLWDFDVVASTLPTKGLGRDNIHLSIFYSHDWRLQRGFTTGHGLHNLTGLIVLDELRQVLQDG